MVLSLRFIPCRNSASATSIYWHIGSYAQCLQVHPLGNLRPYPTMVTRTHIETIWSIIESQNLFLNRSERNVENQTDHLECGYEAGRGLCLSWGGGRRYIGICVTLEISDCVSLMWLFEEKTSANYYEILLWHLSV